MRFFKNQIGLVLAGMLIWLPAWLIALSLGFIGNSLEDLGNKALRAVLPDRFVYAGLGIALGLVFFYLTAVLVKKTPIGKLLAGIPIVGMLFAQSDGQRMTIDRLMHLPPCLFLYSPSCPSFGWILSEEKVRVDGEIAPYDIIVVYYPNVPTLLTGQTFPVRKNQVIRLGNSWREIIDLLLYAMGSPESLKYMPWPGEDPAVFKERSRRFGII